MERPLDQSPLDPSLTDDPGAASRPPATIRDWDGSFHHSNVYIQKALCAWGWRGRGWRGCASPGSWPEPRQRSRRPEVPGCS